MLNSNNRNGPKPTIADLDTYMYRAFDKYKKGMIGGAIEDEAGAYHLAEYLSKEGNKVAERVKSTMLTDEQRQKFIEVYMLDFRLKAEVSSFQNRLDMFNKSEYDDIKRWNGEEKANTTRNEYTNKLETAKAEYQKNSIIFQELLEKIKNGIPLRIEKYEDAKEEPKLLKDRNPIAEMNRVIIDISNASPEYSPQASRMTQQVHTIHDNYLIDLSYGTIVNNLITDLNDNLLPQVERDIQFKKKQMDIQEYYSKNYQQQILILKILVLFSLLALLGGLLLNYHIITVTLFALYLGTVLSIGFIVLFYYLWDFYLRDNSVFDEYNFLIYTPPKPEIPPDRTFDFKDNIIYC